MATNVRSDNIQKLADELIDAYQNGRYDYTTNLNQFTRKAGSKKILALLEDLIR